MDKNIIETFDLTKKFKLRGKDKEITALNKVNLSIKEGEIFGLLGPNGAGKTTMVQILTTLVQPTSGYAVIDGYNLRKKPQQVKSKVGLMLGSEMLYYRITAYDNLKFFAKIYNISNYQKKIYDIVKDFGLEKWLNQYVENFSSGMRMKLALCKTMLLDPKILFLDEPTLGLDVKSTAFIIDKLKNLNKTIFLTSHDMNVVEKLCNRIAFINFGTISKVGTQEELRRIMQKKIKVEIEIFEKKSELKSLIEQKEFITEVINTDNGLIINMNRRDNYKDLFKVFSDFPIRKIKEQEMSLGDLFLKLI